MTALDRPSTAEPGPSAAGEPRPPGTPRAALLIARRAARESLRDRSTVVAGALNATLTPLGFAFAAVGQAGGLDGRERAAGATLAIYLLFVGLLPTAGALGSAAGQFAGEREQGNLTPLLASPASNLAIFAGKTLAAVIPALLFAAGAWVSYLAAVAALAGPAALRALPPGLTAAMLALVPAVALFAAAVAGLVSSRVRTYNGASQLASFAVLPVWGLLGGLAFGMRDWPLVVNLGIALAVLAADAALVLAAARTWRREEILARR